jgi:trehalose 6-phosphate synthase
MTDAVIVNPYSREELAEGLKLSLSMPLEERKARYEGLIDGIRRSNVKVWRDSFVDCLRSAGRRDLEGRDAQAEVVEDRETA